MPRIYFYIARKFWGPFLFALGVFAALVVLGDTFEKLKTLNNGYSTLGAVLSYSLATFPNCWLPLCRWRVYWGPYPLFRKWLLTGNGPRAWRAGFPPNNYLSP